MDAVIVITGMSEERSRRADILLSRPDFSGMVTHRIEAWRGKELYVPEWFRGGAGQRVGAFGCFMSHVHALLWGIKNAERFLVFEDDVVLRREWRRTVESALEELPDSWKMLYLGSSSFHGRQVKRCGEHVGTHLHGGGGHAILWTRRGATEAVEMLLTNPSTYDCALHQFHRRGDTYTTIPLVAGQAADFASDICIGHVNKDNQFWDLPENL